MERIDKYLSTQGSSFIPGEVWQAVALAVSYRVEMRISKVMRFPGGYGAYVCPRCSVTLDKDFQAFCDRCGQKLNWNGCRKAAVIFPGKSNLR